MRGAAAAAMVVAVALALVATVGGCAPIAGVDRFDGDFGAAKERRRVVALASPT